MHFNGITVENNSLRYMDSSKRSTLLVSLTIYYYFSKLPIMPKFLIYLVYLHFP